MPFAMFSSVYVRIWDCMCSIVFVLLPFLVQVVMVVIIRVFLMHLQSIRHHLQGYLRSSVTALGCRIIVSFSSGNRPTIFYVLLWLAGHSWIAFGFQAVCDAHCPAILSLKLSGHQPAYLSILPQFISSGPQATRSPALPPVHVVPTKISSLMYPTSFLDCKFMARAFSEFCIFLFLRSALKLPFWVHLMFNESFIYVLLCLPHREGHHSLSKNSSVLT